MTRIAVLGTGANGGSIGADLTRAGLDVTFIEQWPEHVAAMREHGLRVEMPDASEETPVRAHHLCEVATLRTRFDVVFLLVKAYDTRWACELIKPLVAGDGVVVGVQNGMTLETIADVVGADRAVGAVIEVASNMFTPGVIHRDTPRSQSWFAVGGLTPDSQARATQAAALLRNSGTVEVSDDILSSKWMKLVANCTELVTSAVLNLTVHEAAAIPGVREIMVEAGNEAVRTGISLGHTMRPVLGLTAADFADPEKIAATLLDTVHDKFVTPGQQTTVLQDWIKGRRSEVHQINGHIVAQQARLGGRAPVNERVVEIAARIEEGELEPEPAVADLLLSATVG
ncbi:ketopantoate reductase family protein [Amycolatopsis sp. GM8]|uniref:ketopantoate reductase family protein n=1 Tax=Amycolatopsis sp. GM8 TaxID=2896530 RepID=UPI001EFFB097|nr:2-dehydropantoate 2-reductase [Amycolatopsis sp. GM8]